MPCTTRRTKHRTFELDLPVTNRYTHEVLMSAIHESLSLAELLEITAEIKILDQDHFDICTQKTRYWLNALQNGQVATDYSSHHPFQRLQTRRLSV